MSTPIDKAILLLKESECLARAAVAHFTTVDTKDDSDLLQTIAAIYASAPADLRRMYTQLEKLQRRSKD